MPERITPGNTWAMPKSLALRCQSWSWLGGDSVLPMANIMMWLDYQ